MPSILTVTQTQVLCSIYSIKEGEIYLKSARNPSIAGTRGTGWKNTLYNPVQNGHFYRKYKGFEGPSVDSDCVVDDEICNKG
jgi:hypothetical protein